MDDEEDDYVETHDMINVKELVFILFRLRE
jgi:hypothetical protein